MSEALADTTLSLWTSSLEDSPAKTSPQLVAVRGSKRARARASGSSLPASFASFDPATSSWKTYPSSEAAASTAYSGTWPRAGMTRNGTASQLSPLAPLTDVIGSGLWPTPTARDGMGGPGTSPKRLGGMNLRTAVMMWPTPRASDGERGGRGDLIQAVRGNPNKHYKLWPTPTSRDHKDVGDCANVPENSLLGRTVKPSKAEGSLHPEFAGWLMGFPAGWTDLGDSGTRLSRKSSSGSAGASSKRKTVL
jgi:hypothetical protein